LGTGVGGGPEVETLILRPPLDIGTFPPTTGV